MQTRNGFNGHAFRIVKFRSMHVLEDGGTIRQATRDDPRVTRIGRWLTPHQHRRTPATIQRAVRRHVVDRAAPTRSRSQQRVRETHRQIRL